MSISPLCDVLNLINLPGVSRLDSLIMPILTLGFFCLRKSADYCSPFPNMPPVSPYMQNYTLSNIFILPLKQNSIVATWPTP